MNHQLMQGDSSNPYLIVTSDSWMELMQGVNAQIRSDAKWKTVGGVSVVHQTSEKGLSRTIWAQALIWGR